MSWTTSRRMAEQQQREQAPERELEQQILQIKKQHQLQHQILLQHFQQQQQHLAEQHEQQLKQHLQEFWERQRQLEQLRQREHLESLRRKEKHEESAVASSEVKYKLQAFLLQRSGCSAAKTARAADSSCWSEGMDTGSDTSTTNNDFPLRKTASEPNLLKVRLKQRVMERTSRCNPMSKRLPPLKKKLLSSVSNTCAPASDSPPHPNDVTSTSLLSNNLAAKELSPPAMAAADAALDEYRRHAALFSSPSMPNISLAAHRVLSPPQAAAPAAATAPADLSEAAARAAATARLGVPLTGQMLPGTLPFYPSLPAIDSEHEEGGGACCLDTISELQEPQTTTRGVIRPLGRTQSSPLPLGHPLLRGVAGGGAGPPPPPEQVAALPPRHHHTHHHHHQQHTPPHHQQSLPEEQQEQRDLELRANESRSIRPLSRALSSPVVHLGAPEAASLARRRGSSSPTTGLAYDNQMLKHACVCGNNAIHPEHAGRLQSIWSRLLETGLVGRCDRLRPRKATATELQACHTEAHCLLYATSPLNRHKVDMSKLSALPLTAFVRLPCGGVGVDADTTWNEQSTATAARVAAGCVVDLAVRTWTGDVRNGFAVVRPPGHHAEPNQAMGFCFFNSVAVAARALQRDHAARKVLIFDWDVHHGNGTQDIFYEDPRVLVISMHRHDDGNFFPGTGSPGECGAGAGLGFNVNIAWSGGLNPALGDAEYLAAFRSVVMPIARHFDPDIVLVSAGFDAAEGHLPPLGGYRVSAACFGFMTRQLMQLAGGKVVLALEGGYDLPSICDAAEECVRVLLGEQPSSIDPVELSRAPCANATLALQKVLTVQTAYWPCLQESAKTAVCSFSDALRSEKEDKDTVSAMASLSMQHQQSNSSSNSMATSPSPPGVASYPTIAAGSPQQPA